MFVRARAASGRRRRKVPCFASCFAFSCSSADCYNREERLDQLEELLTTATSERDAAMERVKAVNQTITSLEQQLLAAQEAAVVSEDIMNRLTVLEDQLRAKVEEIEETDDRCKPLFQP